MRRLKKNGGSVCTACLISLTYSFITGLWASPEPTLGNVMEAAAVPDLLLPVLWVSGCCAQLIVQLPQQQCWCQRWRGHPTTRTRPQHLCEVLLIHIHLTRTNLLWGVTSWYISLTRQAKAKMQPMESKSFSKGYVCRRGGSYCDLSVFDPSPLWPAFSLLPGLMSLHRIFHLTFTKEQIIGKEVQSSLPTFFSGLSCLLWPGFLRDSYLCISALTTLIMAGRK